MKKILDTWKELITEKKEIKHIASVFIINENDEVLLILRSSSAKKNPNVWEVPGGHVDPEDKDYKAAAVREAKEEVGLDVSNLRKLETEEYSNRIKHYFVTDQYSGKIVIEPNPETGITEHSDHKWVDLEDLKNLKQQSRVSRYLMEKAIEILRGKK
tara:strand:- start:792 stop:1262 length:471 start_codon:yes stop_codon:yes gene_type:complete